MENIKKMEELLAEVEIYRKAISDAKSALDSVEQELDDTLADAYWDAAETEDLRNRKVISIRIEREQKTDY